MLNQALDGNGPGSEKKKKLVRVCFGVGFDAGYETVYYYYYRLAYSLLYGMVVRSTSGYCGRDDINTGYGE